MKTLLDIYYWLKTHKKSEKIFHSIGVKFVKLFGLTIPNFFPCLLFDMHGDRFRGNIRYRNGTKRIEMDNLDYFINAMDRFCEECKNNTAKHFEVIRYDPEIRNTKDPFASNIPRRKDIKAIYCPDVPEPLVHYVDMTKLFHEDNPESKAANLLEKTREAFSGIRKYAPEYYGIFHVLGVTEFGRFFRVPVFSEQSNWKVAYKSRRVRPDDKPFFIKSPGHPDSKYFSQYFQSFFIKYQFVMGSFEEIKICKHCNKLFHRMRSDQDFCSAQCRHAYHIESQPEPVRLCRERQNGWLRYWLNNENIVYKFPPSPNHVNKMDCMACMQPAPTGSCPSMRKRNQKAIDEFERQLNSNKK
jgi:hypothetical protein